jgi:hypothetical protein
VIDSTKVIYNLIYKSVISRQVRSSYVSIYLNDWPCQNNQDSSTTLFPLCSMTTTRKKESVNNLVSYTYNNVQALQYNYFIIILFFLLNFVF